MTTAITQLNPCPHCGHLFNAATSFQSDALPVVGDASICIECGEWNVFNDDLTLRKPSDDELIEIGLDPEARKVRQIWVKVNRDRR